MAKERILVTGASGFIGSFIAEEALRRGMEVWAVVRRSSSLRYLQDARIHLVYSDLSSAAQIEAALRGLELNYVVHAAGCTKALRKETFYRVNTDGTANLCTALMRSNPSLRRFLFLSSLSVFGAAREGRPYTEILPTDAKCPNTHYGRSKLQAERWLETHCTLPFTVLRPTGVYGPREKDYMMMVDSIRRHVDVASGWSRQDLTFVYVRDVVEAVFLSMKSAKTAGKAYFLSDGQVYDSRDFSELVKQALGVRWALRLVLPLWALRALCAAGDVWMRLTGRPSTLNLDHYSILAQRNWRCDITPARRDFGYAPAWQLPRGVAEMLSNA